MFSKPLEVGLDKIKKNKKKQFIIYKDCELDEKGWINPDKYRPLQYDLCHLRTTKKVKMGWWNGEKWDGLRLKDEDQVLGWKLNSMVI